MFLETRYFSADVVHYHFPMEKHAYDVNNEYFFGSELLVLPITTKKDNETLYGSDLIYFPEGNWFDIFSNFRYKGGSKLKLYRETDRMPVFAKEGGIIPMDADPVSTPAYTLPNSLEWMIYPGQSNSFELIEDVKQSRAVTELALNYQAQTIHLTVKGETSVLPEGRVHSLHFNASEQVELIKLEGGELIEQRYTQELNRTTITIKMADEKELKMTVKSFKFIDEQDISDELFNRLNTAQVGYFLKDDLYNDFNNNHSEFSLLSTINELEEEHLSQSLFELLYIKNS